MKKRTLFLILLNQLFLDMDAFIFARGGSKGIKNKNLAPFANSSLLGHTIDTLIDSRQFSHIYVSSDSTDILATAKNHSAHTIKRPSYLATDTANELDAWSHALASLDYPPDKSFFVAPVTSPLRIVKDICSAIRLWDNTRYDVMLSCKPSDRNPYLNMVTQNDLGQYLPLEYIKPIHRRQDAPPFFDVLTYLYITSFAFLQTNQPLVSSRVQWFNVDPKNSIDIDSPFDLNLARLFYLNE